MRVLTSDEVRQIEVEAASRTDTSTSLLIQSAGYAVAQFILPTSRPRKGQREVDSGQNQPFCWLKTTTFDCVADINKVKPANILRTQLAHDVHLCCARIRFEFYWRTR